VTRFYPGRRGSNSLRFCVNGWKSAKANIRALGVSMDATKPTPFASDYWPYLRIRIGGGTPISVSERVSSGSFTVHCLLIQPIHADGIALLRDAGITTELATAADMPTVAKEIAQADAVITRNAGLDALAMDAARSLKMLAVHGTGYDRVDVEHANQLALPVVHTPFSNVQSVAEHAISQMLAIAKRTREADRAVREGRFGYRYENAFHELSGKTLAIIGFGKIGQRTAEIAKHAFQMNVVVYSPNANPADIESAGMTAVSSLDAALVTADVVSLHQRLTPQSHGVFNAQRFASMKPGAMLVNTARGGLIDAAALIASLESGHLGGAAMDVFEQEPLPLTHEFIRCDRLVLSPHISAATEEAMKRMATDAARQIIDGLAGRKPQWLVNPDVWPHRRMKG